jgi:hypothetical protein
MVKDPGKVIKMHGGTSTRKEGTAHTAGVKIPSLGHGSKILSYKGTSGPPKSPPKKGK